MSDPMTLLPVNSPYPNTLAGKRVLVTGGAGFVGSHIVDQLIAHEAASVLVIDNMVRGRPANLAAALQSGCVTLIEGDIRDTALMEALVREADVVFHQAALASVPRSVQDPAQTSEVNVQGTLNVLLAARDAGIQRVVNASCASVYGDSPHRLQGEDQHRTTQQRI